MCKGPEVGSSLGIHGTGGGAEVAQGKVGRREEVVGKAADGEEPCKLWEGVGLYSEHKGKWEVLEHESDMVWFSMFSKDHFTPKPKVDSTVFKLTLKNEDRISNFRDYYEFLLVIFNAKRKTILNNLIKKYKKEDVINAVEGLKLSTSLRPEDLDVDQMVNLYLKLN